MLLVHQRPDNLNLIRDELVQLEGARSGAWPAACRADISKFRAIRWIRDL